MKTLPTINRAAAQPTTHASESRSASAIPPEQTLETLRAESYLLHRLESQGKLGAEGKQLIPSIDEAIAELESILAEDTE